MIGQSKIQNQKWARFLAVLLSLVACVGIAEAQQPGKMARIGILSPVSPMDAAPWHQSFRQGLSDYGWVEGKNIGIEYRYAEGRNDRIPDLAADLVRLKVDIIVATTSTEALAAKAATKTIPVIMASAADPIPLGLVDSLAHPGGNITGLSQLAPELSGKRLELLKETVPKLNRVAVLWNPEAPASTLGWKESQLPARQFNLELHSMEVRRANEFDKAFEGATKAHVGALAIMPSPLFIANRKRLADLAAKGKLPSVFHLKDFVEAGGLMSYGPDRADMFRRAATYVDKILKGAKPADLPVEQPTKFEFVINLKAAKQIGLTIPQSVLYRADKVIK